MFGTDLNNEYEVLVDHFGFGAGELERISLNALHASLLPRAGKAWLEDEFRVQFAQLRAELSA
jgi:adenosine deaminase